MKDEKKRARCVGCRNDFYNDKNPFGVKRCWSLETARVVTRFRIANQRQPDSVDAFQKVRTLSCYHEPGYAHFERLPDHLLRLKRRKPAEPSHD